jgi:predicted dehydrogenase
MSGYNLDRVSAGGGVLVVTGSHFLDRMLFLWGYPDGVEFVDDSEGGPEANCRASFRFARPDGSFEGWAIYSKTTSLSPVLAIETDRGVVIAPDSDSSDILFRAHGEPNTENIIRRRGAPREQEDVFRLQIEDFVEAIRKGRRPQVDGKQAVESLRLIEQLYACRKPMSMDFYSESTNLADVTPKRIGDPASPRA